MSVSESNHRVPLGSVAMFRVVSFFERIYQGFAFARRARATEAALSELSDAQLADIGLHRGEIPQVATRLARG